mgnify:FL=1
MNNEEYNTKKWSLKACRVNEKLSREEVAQRLGLSVETVISHENGKGIPLYSQLEKYSQIYQVPIDKINSEYR